MSRLIEKINQNSRITPQPLGFGRGAPVIPKPKMLLVAFSPRPDVALPAASAAGADAGIIASSGGKSNNNAFKGFPESMPDIPWGVWLGGGNHKVPDLTALGSDFIVFPAGAPLGALAPDSVPDGAKGTHTGRILEVDEGLSDGLLKAVDDLPVDGVIIAPQGDAGVALTWQRLMSFRRIANLISKPLLAMVPTGLTAVEIKALWEAGISGIIVTVAESGEGVASLRATIDKITFPSKKRRGVGGAIRVRALIPRASEAVEAEPDEEEPEGL